MIQVNLATQLIVDVYIQTYQTEQEGQSFNLTSTSWAMWAMLLMLMLMSTYDYNIHG